MNDFQTTVRMLRYWHPTVMERGPSAYPVIADYVEDYGESSLAREAATALRTWYESWWTCRELSADKATWLARVNEKYGPREQRGTNYTAPMRGRCLLWANELEVTETLLPNTTPEVCEWPIQRMRVATPWYATIEMLQHERIMAHLAHLVLDFTGAMSATELGMLYMIEKMQAPSLVSLDIHPPATNLWAGVGQVSVALMKNPYVAKRVRLLWRGKDT
jgi:hypothetical protein